MFVSQRFSEQKVCFGNQKTKVSGAFVSRSKNSSFECLFFRKKTKVSPGKQKTMVFVRRNFSFH